MYAVAVSNAFSGRVDTVYEVLTILMDLRVVDSYLRQAGYTFRRWRKRSQWIEYMVIERMYVILLLGAED